MYLPIWMILVGIVLLVMFGYLLCAILVMSRESEDREALEEEVLSLREAVKVKNALLERELEWKP